MSREKPQNQHVGSPFSAPSESLVTQRQMALLGAAFQSGPQWGIDELARALLAARAGAAPAAPPPPRQARKQPARDHARDRSVFVVHGRDHATRDRVFAFLRAIGLRPIEWDEAVSLTGKGSPYIGEILDAGLSRATATLVLLTGDDEARLREDLLQEQDPSYEREFTRQARPNVIFEAGMALARAPRTTILVQIGCTRPFSDVHGRHIPRLDDGIASQRRLVQLLMDAGCRVARAADWRNKRLLRLPLEKRSRRNQR